MEPKPPLPPFDAQSAAAKVRLAEDAWNSRDPDRVVLEKPQSAEANLSGEDPKARRVDIAIR